MNASNVQILSTPSQVVKDLKDLDIEVLKSTLINSPESIVTTINHLYNELNRPGADKEFINKDLDTMREILHTKITLTKHVLGVKGNSHAFVSTESIQKEIQFEQEKDIKTEPVKVTGFKKDADVVSTKENKSEARVIKMTPIAKTDLPFFEGYVRKAVLGTATELPKKVQYLISKYNAEKPTGRNSDIAIDEIVKEVVKVGQYEDALNLMIDMRRNADNKLKIEAVEKEFLFRILPWVLEVGVEPKDNMENISLSMWIDQLKQKKDPNNAVNILAEEVKKIPGLTASITTNEGCKKMTDDILAGIPQKHTSTMVQDEKTSDIKDLEAEIINELNSGTAQGKVVKLFYEKARKIMSFDKNRDFLKKTLDNCISLWKDNLQEKAEAEVVKDEVSSTTDDKKEVVVDAQTNINTPKEETVKTPEDTEYAKAEFEQAAKAMLLASLSDPTINAKNEFDKMAKKAGAKKMYKDLSKAYTAWRTDLIAANPNLLSERKTVIKKPLFKIVNISEKHPDVWESAKLTKTLEDFKALIYTIIFNKTKELPNGWIIAANLVDQYINNFEETKSLEGDAKNEWFQLFMEAKTKERKEAETTVKKEEKEEKSEQITEEIKENIEQPIIETTVKPVESDEKKETVINAKPFDAKKYTQISTEGNKSKLNALAGDFLRETSHGTLEERKIELVNMLKNNKRYYKSKDEEIINYISKIIATNGDIKKLA